MKLKVGRILIGILEITMQLLVGIFLALSFLCMAYQKAFTMEKVFILLLPVILFYLARYIIKPFWLFILIHLAVFYPVIILSGPLQDQVVFIVVTLCFTFLSFSYRLQELKSFGMEKMHLASLGVFALAYFLGSHFQVERLSDLAYYAIFIFVVCFLFHSYLTELNKFLHHNMEKGGFPKRQIISVNSFSFFLQLLAVSLAMFLMPKISMFFVHYVKDAILGFIKWILGILISLFSGEEQEEYVPPIVMPQETQEDIEWMEPIPPPKLFQVIHEILYYAFIVLAVIAGILLICYFAYWIYKRYNSVKGKEQDEIEFIFSFKKEQIDTVVLENKKKRSFFLSNNEKIRQLFVKKVERTKEKGSKIPYHLTPREIMEFIKDESEQSKDLTELYEKARYGWQECSDEELRRKVLLRRETTTPK